MPSPLTAGYEPVSCISVGNCLLAQILWWFFFFFLVRLPSEIPKLHTDSAKEKVSYCVKISPPSWFSPQDRSLSLNRLSLFSPLSFVLLHLKEIGLPFWVHGVLCQRLQVVLWKLLHMHIVFDVFVWDKVVSPSYSFGIHFMFTFILIAWLLFYNIMIDLSYMNWP